MTGDVDEPPPDEYAKWKSLVPVLYDWLVNHNLTWPSLSCRWGPVQELHSWNLRQTLYLSEQTDGSEPNKLVLAHARVLRPRVAAAKDIAHFNEEMRSAFIHKKKAIYHPGEVNRLREVPQAPELLVTHTDSPEVLLWNMATQPSRTPDNKAPSVPDAILAGHTADTTFALACSPAAPEVCLLMTFCRRWLPRNYLYRLPAEDLAPASSCPSLLGRCNLTPCWPCGCSPSAILDHLASSFSSKVVTAWRSPLAGVTTLSCCGHLPIRRGRTRDALAVAPASWLTAHHGRCRHPRPRWPRQRMAARAFSRRRGSAATARQWSYLDPPPTAYDMGKGIALLGAQDLPFLPPFFQLERCRKADVVWHPAVAGQLASVGDDRALLFWDARASNKPVATLAGAHGSDIHCVDWSALAPELLATGGADSNVKVFDRRRLVAAGLHTLQRHSGAISCVQWCPHARGVLASAAEDRLIHVWDLGRAGAAQSAEAAKGGPPELIFQHAGHRWPLVEFQWNPAPELPWTIMSASDDTGGAGGGTLQLWRPSDFIYRPEAEVVAELETHRNSILEAAPTAPCPA